MKKLLPLFILILAGFAFGQIGKGDSVVPKFPQNLATFDKLKVWSLRYQYKLNVAKAANGYALNGSTDWAETEFPYMNEFIIRELDLSKKKPTRVLLIAEGAQIEIFVPNDLDLQNVLSSILFKGKLSDFWGSDYMVNTEKVILPRIFKDKLAVIPFEKQQGLIRQALYSTDAYSHETFKEKDYLAVSFKDGFVYNTIQVNQAERASRLTQTAITKLKDIQKRVGKLDGFHGIKLVTDIQSRDFLKEKYSKPHIEKYEIYVTYEILQKFLEAEITNQELIDGSIILVDGGRVKVDVTSFS